jgi:hypothetical protein
MNKKCTVCHLANFANAAVCVRCGGMLGKTETIPANSRFLNSALIKRASVCLAVIMAALIGFYASLVFSAAPLSSDERQTIDMAIEILADKGFADEVFLLRRLAVFRANDNWLNASVAKENAYAATNFPFGIVTIYPDFFTYPVDLNEQAAILLHESKHLQGKDEKEAYEFVWKNRERIGWTSDDYSSSPIWQNVRKQTREMSPETFVCDVNPYNDCTEKYR